MQDLCIDRRSEADAAEVLELLVTVFDDTSPAWFKAGRTDPPYPESFGFVARAGGRIVSHAEVLEMPVRYGEVTLRMGAVSGVVTLPEWRGRGLASAVMERLVAEMTARQIPFSLLMTGSQAFYERLGWSEWTPPGRSMRWADALGMVDQHARGGPAQGPGARRGPEPYVIAPYKPADLGEMMALYDRYSAGRPVTLLRPERYWRSVMRRWLEVTEYPGQRNEVYVARHQGRLVAYGFVFSEEDALFLSEVAYEERETVAPLVRAVVEGAGDPAPQRLVAVLPWESAALRLMETTGCSMPNDPMGLMWRINDLPGLLREVRSVLERRLTALPRSSHAAENARLLLGCERAEVALAVSGGRLEIDSPDGLRGRSGLPCCRLAQSDLVTLLLGSYTSVGWLEELGLPEEARPWIARLFPPSGGIFWLTDNF
jgi:predicted N-acetyltransferase YhbS